MTRCRARLLTLVGTVAVLAGCVGAHAQTLTFGVSGSLGDPTSLQRPAAERVSLGVEGARVRGERVDLALAYDGAVQLDFGVQANTTFGPLGNLIGEGHVSVRTDAQAQGDLGMRGVLGPVALGVQLSAFTADPARFDPLALADATRPDFGSSGFGTSVDASGRPSRTVVLQVNPQLYLVPAGLAARASARVRFLRALGRNELSLRALGYVAPHFSAVDAALGVGVTLKRRQAPDLDGAVFLGWSPRGLAPGATTRLAQQLGPVMASLSIDVEPFRLDVPPYRATVGLDFGLGPGQAHLKGAGAVGPAGPSGSLALSYQLPVAVTE